MRPLWHLCAQGQNFEAYYFSMANNALHNLRLLQINLLIVIYLDECPSGRSPFVRFPTNQLFLHGFQQYLLIQKILLTNIAIWLCCQVVQHVAVIAVTCRHSNNNTKCIRCKCVSTSICINK